MLKSDFYYFTAVSSVIISFITLCALLLTLPKIHMEAEYERENIMQKSEQFKVIYLYTFTYTFIHAYTFL